jgi:hypothetical protein
MEIRLLVIALAGASLGAACGGASERADAPPGASGAQPPGSPGAVSVALADSVPYENEMTSGYLWRAVVRSAGRVDTLAGILVAELPVVASDGVVYGIRADEERAAGLFAYDPRDGRLRLLPTPTDWWESATPRIAPDGRHVAYLAQKGDGHGYAAVAALPSGEIVYRAPAVAMLETDAGIDEIHWPDNEHFEVRIALSFAVGGTLRVRGSVRPAAARVDTLRPPPG